MNFVILATNNDLRVWVVGTNTGKPFTSQKAAEKKAKVLEREFLHLQFVVSEIIAQDDL